MARREAIVHIDQIGKPRDGCPSLFRIPSPIMPPGIFGPQCSEQHTDSEKSPAYIDHIVDDIELFGFGDWGRGGRKGDFRRRRHAFFIVFTICKRYCGCPMCLDQQVGSHECSGTKKSVCKHVDDDMWGKPRTLQGRHHGLGVNLRLEDIDAYKDRSKNGGERENPLITPTGIDDDAGQRQEERIPKARFTHGAHGRAFQCDPHHKDVSQEDAQTYARGSEGRNHAAFPSGQCSG